MKTYLPFLVFAAVVACAPAPEIKHRAPLFKKSENLVVLSEKADQDLITTKFKKSIKLKCDFFIDNRPDFDLSTARLFSGFTVNLATGEVPANLLSTMANGQMFTTGVRVKSLDIVPELSYKDEKDVLHVMKNTPLVELIIRGRDVRGNSDKRYETHRLLGEQRPIIVTDLYPSKYPHILKCELQTTIAKDFESDYTEIAPVVEEPKPEVATPVETAPPAETTTPVVTEDGPKPVEG